MCVPLEATHELAHHYDAARLIDRAAQEPLADRNATDIDERSL
ncbi:hypothetical protein [Methylobacterium sp. Leaf123]|nr:hypothetical protein [Methylobacterium sp. Leaf123]